MSEINDKKFMSLALRLAKKGEGSTSPNPMVGAVLVKNGKIIGKGYHKRAGMPHAEIEAFTDARIGRKSLKGATLYINLEPCCHTNKRTPPCVNEIVSAGIRKVVIGAKDQNPEVSGNSIKILRKNGIEVTTGVLEDECNRINEWFFKYVTEKIPYVVLKFAATYDGKIASFTGDSKWIGSEVQRRFAHRLRNSADAVLVGIETVLKDNPSLNVRLPNKRYIDQPKPIILDSKLRIPSNAKLIRLNNSPIIATANHKNNQKLKRLEKLGVKVLKSRTDSKNMINLKSLLKELGKLNIAYILVEGGSTVAASFLRSKLVDRVIFFYSPRILGADGISMIGNLKIKKVKDSINIKNVRFKGIGEEFYIEGDIDK